MELYWNGPGVFNYNGEEFAPGDKLPELKSNVATSLVKKGKAVESLAGSASAANSDVKKLESKIRGLREDLKGLKIENKNLAAELKNAGAVDIDALNEKLNDAANEIIKLDGELKTANENIVSLTEAKETLAGELETANTEIKTLKKAAK